MTLTSLEAFSSSTGSMGDSYCRVKIFSQRRGLINKCLLQFLCFIQWSPSTSMWTFNVWEHAELPSEPAHACRARKALTNAHRLSWYKHWAGHQRLGVFGFHVAALRSNHQLGTIFKIWRPPWEKDNWTKPHQNTRPTGATWFAVFTKCLICSAQLRCSSPWSYMFFIPATARKNQRLIKVFWDAARETLKFRELIFVELIVWPLFLQWPPLHALRSKNMLVISAFWHFPTGGTYSVYFDNALVSGCRYHIQIVCLFLIHRFQYQLILFLAIKIHNIYIYIYIFKLIYILDFF